MGSSKSKVDCAVWIPSKTDPLLVKDQDGREGEISSYSLNSIYDPALEKAIYEARNIAAEPIVKAYSANYETKGPALHPNTEFKVVT